EYYCQVWDSSSKVLF
nr:immunoglobulin light chain junction region [Macaca mulatta]